MSCDHGAPVESVLAFPTGAVCLTAGDNFIKVFSVGRCDPQHSSFSSLGVGSPGRGKATCCFLKPSEDNHIDVF